MAHYVRGLRLVMTKCYRHSSVSIICYSLYKNELYFLLGKETKRKTQKHGKWCAFGSSEYAETVVETAVREFMEESLLCYTAEK